MGQKTGYKQIFVSAVSLIAIFALLACASADTSVTESRSAPAAGSLGIAAMSPIELTTSPIEQAAGEAASDAAGGEEMTVASVATNPLEVSTTALQNRKIKRNAYLRIEAKDVIGSLNQVTLLSARYGGYTAGSRTWYVDDLPYASYNFAVPVEQFEAALEETRRLGIVKDENVTSQDVTGQFVDLEARITNLEITAERIRGFLAETKKVEEALAVNRELSRVEEELEQLKGQRNALATQTAFSTISIELVPPPPIPTTVDVIEEAKAWSPLTTFNAALEVMIRLAQLGIDTAIWVLVLAGPAVVMVVFALWIGRRFLFSLRRASV